MTLIYIYGDTYVLVIWRVWRTSFLLSLSDPFWPELWVPLRVPSRSQIYLFKNDLYSIKLLIPYHSRFFVWSIVTWRYDYLLRINISYLEPYNYEQTKYKIEINTWNHRIISIR